ncbi:hypothetical protein NSTC731_05902 [Nostoc sp. DSM 114167]
MLLAIVIGCLLFPEFMMRKIYAKTLDKSAKVTFALLREKGLIFIGERFFYSFSLSPKPNSLQMPRSLFSNSHLSISSTFCVVGISVACA